MRVAKINEEYNQTLKMILNTRFLTVSQKMKLIHEIEFKKAQQINAVNTRFFNERNKYNDLHYDRNFNWIR